MRKDTDVHQLTMRMSEKLFQDSKMEADLIGSSHNSYMVLMMKLGMKVYNGTAIIQQKRK